MSFHIAVYEQTSCCLYNRMIIPQNLTRAQSFVLLGDAQNNGGS